MASRLTATNMTDHFPLPWYRRVLLAQFTLYFVIGAGIVVSTVLHGWYLLLAQLPMFFLLSELCERAHKHATIDAKVDMIVRDTFKKFKLEDEATPCTMCNGEGYVENPNDHTADRVPCPECNYPSPDVNSEGVKE